MPRSGIDGSVRRQVFSLRPALFSPRWVPVDARPISTTTIPWTNVLLPPSQETQDEARTIPGTRCLRTMTATHAVHSSNESVLPARWRHAVQLEWTRQMGWWMRTGPRVLVLSSVATLFFAMMKRCIYKGRGRRRKRQRWLLCRFNKLSTVRNLFDSSSLLFALSWVLDTAGSLRGTCTWYIPPHTKYQITGNIVEGWLAILSGHSWTKPD